MELLRTWVLGVTAASLVVAVAEALMPQGAVKKVGRLTGGLILALVLLQPLTGMDDRALYDWLSSLPVEALDREELTNRTTASLEEGIEAELAAYIAEKGAALGCSCTARVDCIPDETGVPIPAGVVVTGAITPSQQEELRTLIAEDLGIGPEDQQYISEETT